MLTTYASSELHIVHLKGDACAELAKKHKIQDANFYFCLGGRPTLHAAGGVAEKGAVCDSNVGGRAAFTQYIVESSKTGMPLSKAAAKVVTAEVIHDL